VQLGLDPELARLDDVPEGVDHLLHALVVGTDRPALAHLAARHRIPAEAVAALLAAVGPALLADRRESPAAVQVLVDGPEDLRDLLTARLDAEPVPSPSEVVLGRALVVVTAHHVIAPARTVAWLAADVPHLGVVFGDQAVRVGPLVLPGETPCLRCAEEHRLADAARRAIAAQLLRRTTSLAAGSLPLGLRTAARVAEAVQQLREGVPTGLEAVEERLGFDGSVSRRATPWHDRCWCREPAGPRPAPGGSGRASAPPVAARRSAPTTAEAGPWPA
jgi:hypothetical protein